jgi:Amt family ammonium transporter
MGATFSKGVVHPRDRVRAFQATFAAITCCLIVGAFAERIKFSAVLLFMVLWFTFSYAADRPHGVVLDGPGRLHRQGSRRRR